MGEAWRVGRGSQPWVRSPCEGHTVQRGVYNKECIFPALSEGLSGQPLKVWFGGRVWGWGEGDRTVEKEKRFLP